MHGGILTVHQPCSTLASSTYSPHHPPLPMHSFEKLLSMAASVG